MRGNLLSVAVVTTFAASTAAWAADDVPSVEPELAKVVVTAQRRAESIEDVPMSIAALSGGQLEARGITDLAGLAGAVPGLNFSEVTPGRTQVAIRGIYAVAGSSPVGMYLNESEVSGGGSSDLVGSTEPALFDIARVEVLRGPQGTLYGGGSIGGTLRYITNMPEFDNANTVLSVQGSLIADADEYGGRIMGATTVPLIDDKLAVRFAGLYQMIPGYIDRVVPPEVNPAIHSQGTFANSSEGWRGGARLSLRYQPTDRISLEGFINYQKLRYDDQPVFDNNMGESAKGARFAEPIDDRFTLSSLKADIDFGPVVLSSISSYFDREYFFLSDNTDVYVNISWGRFTPATRSLGIAANTSISNAVDAPVSRFSQELRLASAPSSEKWKWVVGAYYAESELGRYQDVLDPVYFQAYVDTLPRPASSAPVVAPNGIVFQGRTTVEQTDKAVFADVRREIGSKLGISAGVRYYQNDGLLDRATQSAFSGGVLVEELGLKSSESGYTPKVTFDFKPNEDLMLYATASKGFRPGAPNRPVNPTQCVQDALAALGLTRAPTGYDGDTVWNYEIGTKGSFLGNRASVNLAVFKMDWQKVQQVTPLTGCGYSFVSNTGGAQNEGVELEFQLRPVAALLLTGGLAYNNAQLTEPAPTLGGAVGDPIQNTPEMTWQVAGEYRFGLPHGANLAMRLDYSHRDEVFRNFIRDSFDYRGDAYHTSSLRFAYEPDADWSLSLLVTNLTNEQPLLTEEERRPRAPVANRYGRYQTLTPRTVALEFVKQF